MGSGGHERKEEKKIERERERERLEVPESHGNSKPDKSERLSHCGTAPEEKGSATDEEETRNARDKGK
jgi:hypothetical protein